MPRYACTTSQLAPPPPPSQTGLSKHGKNAAPCGPQNINKFEDVNTTIDHCFATWGVTNFCRWNSESGKLTKLLINIFVLGLSRKSLKVHSYT